MSRLTTSPYEIQKAILAHLPRDALRNTRLVCKSVNSVATQLLYTSLTLRPNERSASNLIEVADSAHLRVNARDLI